MTARILVIDDDPAIRSMLGLYLRGLGYEVATAASGEEGLAAVGRDEPALVLCDLRMPGVDGLDVLARLRRGHPDLPVIVVSGTGAIADAIAALKLGAADYVTKPIEDLEVLDHAIARALERVRLVEENRAYREHLEAANARLTRTLRQLEEDEACGREIQFALLPAPKVVLGGFECSSVLATSAILSGDFVDYFTIDDDHFGFYIADVSGHGVPSAVVTVLLKGYVGRYLEYFRCFGDRSIAEPATLLGALNHDVRAAQHGKYLTMFYGCVTVSSGRLDYANAGQMPFPLLYDGEGVREIGGRSPPVGLFESPRYATQSLEMGATFALRMFSDGVLELLPDDGLQARKDALRALAGEPGRDAAQLAAALGLTQGRVLPDDASILSVRRLSGHD